MRGAFTLLLICLCNTLFGQELLDDYYIRPALRSEYGFIPDSNFAKKHRLERFEIRQFLGKQIEKAKKRTNFLYSARLDAHGRPVSVRDSLSNPTHYAPSFFIRIKYPEPENYPQFEVKTETEKVIQPSHNLVFNERGYPVKRYVQRPMPLMGKDSIVWKYNEKGQLIEELYKIINSPALKTVYSYNPQGKCTKIRVYKTKMGEEEDPNFFQLDRVKEYHYPPQEPPFITLTDFSDPDEDEPVPQRYSNWDAEKKCRITRKEFSPTEKKVVREELRVYYLANGLVDYVEFWQQVSKGEKEGKWVRFYRNQYAYTFRKEK